MARDVSMDAMDPLGPYRVERRLGGGGMGEVYLAVDPRLDRRVALKRLRPDRAVDRQRLHREAKALARLHHPSIVQCFDLLVVEDDEWMVLEYVDGPTLADLVAASPLPLDRVLDIGRQIAEGLQVAHAHGILHRDLKAENVVIDHVTDRAKLLDFGLARWVEGATESERLTASGALVGTLRAVAPEQALGLEVGPRTDLFSLGVLVHEMLTGESPFRGDSPTVTISRVLASAPAPLPAELPGELVELVGRLLEKSPEHRPRDAAEVARRLADVAASLSSADPSSTHASAVSRRALPLDATTFAGDAVDAPVPAARRRVPKAGWVVLVVLVAAGSVGLWRFVESPEAPVPIATHDATEPAASEPIPEAAEGWRALDAYDRFEQIDRAIEVFQARIEASPRDARAADDHIGLARAYWRKFFERTGDPMWLNQAAAVARRAVDLADGTIDESRARTSLGLVLVEMGEIETARDQLVRALALDPSDADAHRGLGAAHQAAERFEAAEASFRRALALRADDRELHDLLGTLHFRLGRYERAEASFRQSIALAPDTVYGYRNLAGVLTVRGELDEAATVLERALTIQSNATLYGNLGTIYFFQGLYSRAADAYEEALDTEYGVYQPVNWANLGDAYRQIPQRRHEASNAFRQAIRLLEARTVEGSDLDDPWQRSLLALYQAKAGLDDEARRTLDGLRADDPRTLLRLVITWEVLGEREQALDRLAAAFEVGLAPVEVEQDPELASLRSDRRFHELLGTLNRVSTRRRNSRHHRPRRRPRR